jgi:hypothetical protein
MLSFCISYWDFIKFPYFADTTERGDRWWNEAQRQGEDTMTLPITLVCKEFDDWVRKSSGSDEVGYILTPTAYEVWSLHPSSHSYHSLLIIEFWLFIISNFYCKIHI